jgi:hypothetical protein
MALAHQEHILTLGWKAWILIVTVLAVTLLTLLGIGP